MTPTELNAELTAIVNALWQCRSINSVAITDDIRVHNAAVVEQWYYDKTSIGIPSEQREVITDYLLYRGTNDGKTSSYFTDEYPYLSEYQERQRHSRETSLEFAEHYDTNGVSRSPKTRTNRLNVEDALNVRKWRLNEGQTDISKGV